MSSFLMFCNGFIYYSLRLCLKYLFAELGYVFISYVFYWLYLREFETMFEIFKFICECRLCVDEFEVMSDLRSWPHLHSSRNNKARIFLKLPGSLTPDAGPWDCNYPTSILALFLLSQIVFPYNNIPYRSAPSGLPCPGTFRHQRRAVDLSPAQWCAGGPCFDTISHTHSSAGKSKFNSRGNKMWT